jgi:ferric-dicitrate binding protein FerR (iron transport regulator)
MQEKGFSHSLLVSRRTVVVGGVLALAALPARTGHATAVIGTADEVRGTVSRKKSDGLAALQAGADIMDRDFIVTGEESFAALTLGRDTRLLLGGGTELLVDSFIAGQGGTIELGTGKMIFDRPEGLPKIDLALRTAFGMIGVRGTKFFVGPNRGVFAVFVERGLVDFSGGGVTRRVGQGEGIDVVPPDAASGRSLSDVVPGEVKRWGAARVREAYASVGVL